MKKRHISPIVAALFTTALLAVGALPALAEDFLGDSTSTDTFTLTVSPYPVPNEIDNSSPNGFFVGLTQGVITDTTLNIVGKAFWMFCTDFNDEINHVPITYDVKIQALAGAPGGPNDPPDPPPGLNENLATLQLQSLLGLEFGPTPSGDTANDSVVQHDIWNLNSPPAGFLPADNPQLDLANAEFAAGANYNGAFLLDVINAGVPADSPGQAFMVNTSGFNNSLTSSPEPGTLAMLGLGLLGLGSLKLRRKRSQR